MTDDLLRQQLQGVTPPDSPTDDDVEDTIVDDEDLDTSAPEGESGDADPNEPESTRDRPDENYFREMIRKSEEREERMLTMMEKLAEAREAPAQPVKQSGNGLDDRSVEELRGLRDQVPDERKAEFDAYLNQRIVREEVEKRLSDFEQRSQARTARERYGQEAVNRYPELSDPSSDFAKKVNSKLKSLGKKYIDANPRAIVDVANEVAISTGQAWRGNTRQGRRPKKSPAGGKGTSPVKEGQKKEGFLAEKRAEEIASKLSRGLPEGKKFDLDKIRERANEYDKNRDLFIK
jgi:hypothetical protein